MGHAFYMWAVTFRGIHFLKDSETTTGVEQRTPNIEGKTVLYPHGYLENESFKQDTYYYFSSVWYCSFFFLLYALNRKEKFNQVFTY